MGSDMGSKNQNGSRFSSMQHAAPLIAAFLAGCLSTILLQRIQHSTATVTRNSSDDCAISFGRYKGEQYVNERQTVQGSPKCLVESKFLKVQQHSVQMFPADGGASSTAADSTTNQAPPVIIDDWLWIDYHNRINVLIEAPTNPNSDSSKKTKKDEPHFLIFRQTKYALEGRDSHAIVGGIIEPGSETPMQAARREVREETGLHCARLQFLGRYRTDVNRGMGWTHTYVAQDCVAAAAAANAEQHDSKNAAAEEEEVGVADTERQDLQTMSLSEVRQAVQEGKFLEIQWSATVALAMLYYDSSTHV